jgi:hypothetical protein
MIEKKINNIEVQGDVLPKILGLVNRRNVQDFAKFSVADLVQFGKFSFREMFAATIS